MATLSRKRTASLVIGPFAAEHIEAAAALLAARHRRDRRRVPALAAEFESASSARAVVQALATKRGGSGVVALRAGRLVGYVLGEPGSRDPEDPFGVFVRPRAGVVQYAGHAATPGSAREIYPQLYAALVVQWLEQGLAAHYISIQAKDRASLETWFSLGFGHDNTYAARETTPVPLDFRADGSTTVRKATTSDAGVLTEQGTATLDALTGSPACLPAAPAGALPRLHQLMEDLLSQSAYPQWLAFRGDDAVGMQMFADSAHQVPPLLAPERSVYLLGAYTAPHVRGEGVGTMLLAHTLRWAREAGFNWCVLDYLPANLRAARFWEGNGFVPIAYRLCRQLDERVLGARPHHASVEGEPGTPL